MRRCEAKRPVLAVRVSYEANRLGGQLLADAFERLAPTIVRRLAPVWPPTMPRRKPLSPTLP